MATIKYKNNNIWDDAVHPAGSFYFSTVSTSPATLFGGQWTQVTGAAIRGNTSVGYVGSDSHTLTINEMPSHNHVSPRPQTVGNHENGGSLYGSSLTGAWSTGTEYGERMNTTSTGGGYRTLNSSAVLQLLHLVSYSLDKRLEV